MCVAVCGGYAHSSWPVDLNPRLGKVSQELPLPDWQGLQSPPSDPLPKRRASRVQPCSPGLASLTRCSQGCGTWPSAQCRPGLGDSPASVSWESLPSSLCDSVCLRGGSTRPSAHSPSSPLCFSGSTTAPSPSGFSWLLRPVFEPKWIFHSSTTSFWFYFCEKGHWNFDRNVTKPVDCSGQHGHFNNINSSHL